MNDYLVCVLAGFEADVQKDVLRSLYMKASDSILNVLQQIDELQLGESYTELQPRLAPLIDCLKTVKFDLYSILNEYDSYIDLCSLYFLDDELEITPDEIISAFSNIQSNIMVTKHPDPLETVKLSELPPYMTSDLNVASYFLSIESICNKFVKLLKRIDSKKSYRPRKKTPVPGEIRKNTEESRINEFSKIHVFLEEFAHLIRQKV